MITNLETYTFIQHNCNNLIKLNNELKIFVLQILKYAKRNIQNIDILSNICKIIQNINIINDIKSVTYKKYDYFLCSDCD